MPVRFAKPGALISLLAALGLALHEISNLCAGFVTTGGAHTSPGMLGSPLAWQERSRWNDILSGDPIGGLAPEQVWARISILFHVVDTAFVVVYAYALLALIGVVRRVMNWTPRGPSIRLPLLGTVAGVGWLVVMLAGVDVVESVVHAALAVARCPAGACVPTGWAAVAAVLSLGKWGLALLLGVIAGAAAVRAHRWRRAWRVWTAVWAQRFSLLAFLPLAVLGVLPLGTVVYDVFDQLPDVQRAWVDSWRDAGDMVAAGVVAVWAIWLPIFYLGRIRADWAVRREHGGTWWPHYTHPEDHPDRHPRRLSAGFWFGGPTVIVVAAGLAWWSGGEVFEGRLLAFVLLPIVVGGLSVLIAGWSPAWMHPNAPKCRDRGFGRDVMGVGDIITVSAVAITGLGLVRAFTGPVVLDAWGLLDVDGAAEVGQVLLLAAGFAVAVLAWPLSQGAMVGLRDGALGASGRGAVAEQAAVDPDAGADRARGWPALTRAAAAGSKALVTPVVRRSAGPGTASTLDARTTQLRVLIPGLDLPPARDGADPRDTFMLGLIALSTIGFVLLCAFPRQISGFIGALASATLAIGILTVMLGAVVAYAQERQPPEAFQALRLRFRATPVLLLLAMVVLVTALTGGRTDVHPVASPDGPTDVIPDRPSLADAFTAWAGTPDRCTVDYLEDARFTLRPMLMYAAEGGGIRAAYWTASALDRVANPGDDSHDRPTCGRYAALFSAGASGGAVGLTVGRFSHQPLDVAREMAGPDALSAGATGLLAADLLASVAGVRFSTPTDHRVEEQALDRAGLMETAWEDTDGLDALRTSFLPTDAEDATSGDGAVTGQLMLTSSVVWDGCRALLSQIDLSAGARVDDGWPRCGEGEAGDHSFDLFHHYGRGTDPDGGTSEERCLGNPQALTAGLLASRFPYVTPSGVVGPCRSLEPMQLIDGGYTDNTGLGTIVDLAPTWAELVRDHNDQQLEVGSGELIVPMVVYLENGTGKDYTVVGQEAAGVTEQEAEQAEAEVEQEPSTEAQGVDALEETRADGARRLRWPRALGIPEVLVPPIGGITGGGDSKVETALGLVQARTVAEEALCTTAEKNDPCSRLQASPQTDISLYVVHQTPQPSVPAPLGWVLSNASRSEMAADLCVQERNTRDDLPYDPASQQGYGTLRDLLNALGLPADDNCQARTAD